MKARQLSDEAFAALGFPVGVRLTGPIVEAPGRVLFLAHRSGFTADRKPMSDGPFVAIRLQPHTGALLERTPVRRDDPIGRLFPRGLVPLVGHVVASESLELYRRAHHVRERLQPSVIALYDQQRPLDESARQDIAAFAKAFWRVLWKYELPAYETLGREFLQWLAKNGWAPESGEGILP